MKKTIYCLMSAIVLWMLVGCTPQKSTYSSEMWINNTINSINNHFSDGSKPYKLKENSNTSAKDNYQMKMNEQEFLTIDFSTTEPERQGRLRYIVTYNYPQKKAPDYDTVLYIVNVIAKKPFSKVFCDEMLNAPEEVYSIERRGSLKSRNYLVAKYRDQSFFDVGTLEYYQYSKYAFEHNEGDQELVFSGVTAR